MTTDLAVIGLGYVGLPLAQAAVQAGLSVVGYDVSDRVIAGLNSNKSHVDDLSDADIAAMVKAGFSATKDDSVLAAAKAIVICVPTPLSADGGPDLSAVLGATRTIAKNLKAGQLVVLESTTYPGTTEDLVQPILAESGLVVGEDYFLAFSPERIDPGNKKYGMRNTPKVVGGVNPASTDKAVALYEKFVDTVVRAKGAKEAEMAKLLENTYRHINIALVNEMAMFCKDLDIDLWDVIRCAATKPFGFQAFYPGPGVGGHCIPIDPNYLSYQVKTNLGYPFKFVELAQEINAGMPAYVINRIQDQLNTVGKALNGSKVLVLGVTYKPDIADQRESPAIPIGLGLLEKGAQLEFHDPMVETWRLKGRELTRVADLKAALNRADITVMLQDHASYNTDELINESNLLFDTRGKINHPEVERL
ncbi:MAG: nucleotide sugar dehydrogenase [Actinomycetota bacterium]|jgi:UDP-N-acetyl-D-glucosamine dehydrogenase|nr:nucleotide sugar dehydrogenase [Actinomycetota bacterium]